MDNGEYTDDFCPSNVLYFQSLLQYVTRSLAVKKTDFETEQLFQLSITLTRAHKHWDREF